MKTKIVATIGPSSNDAKTIGLMLEAGMDVARINCSHSNPKQIRDWTKLIRRVAKQNHRRVKIMVDLQGPRLRVGVLPKKGRRLHAGEIVTFDTNGNTKRGVIHVDDPYLHNDIEVGHPMFLANGQIELMITSVHGTTFQAKVVHGGHLFSHKAVNMPGTRLTTSGLTNKDIADAKTGLSVGVEQVALSFVQSSADVKALRKIVGKKMTIIAKIEMAMALNHIDGILRATDQMMVARGDLGAEVPVEDVPFLQKHLIHESHRHHRPTIVATQMLISMVDNIHATRAEVSDVANAVLDKTDAVMLSDETAAGKYPVEAVAMMHKIVERAEHHHFTPGGKFVSK